MIITIIIVIKWRMEQGDVPATVKRPSASLVFVERLVVHINNNNKMADGAGRCCSCNGKKAKCKSCVCLKAGHSCTSCHHIPGGRCHNTSTFLSRFCSSRAAAVSASSSLSTSTRTLSSDVDGVATSASDHRSDAAVSAIAVESSSSAVPNPTSPASPSSTPLVSIDLPPAIPSLSQVFKFSLPTLNHLPKKARNAWAALLSDVLSNVADNASDVDSWIKLFMLLRCILFNPPCSRGSHSWWGTVHAVKSRIERWKSGELIDLWTEVINSSQSQPGLRRGKKASASSHRSSNAHRALHAAADGQYQKAIRFLTSEGVTPVNDAVFDEMLQKHPQTSPLPPPLLSPPDPPEVPASVVVKALCSFPAGSAPGPSGLRAYHLKEAFSRCFWNHYVG